MEEKKMDAAESLELIRSMIEKTRTQVERSIGRPFLFMGYLTAAVSLAVWYGIRTTGSCGFNFLWFLIPLAGITAGAIDYRRQQRSAVTGINRILRCVWIVFGVTGFVQSVMPIFLPLSVLYIIILMMGMGTALTGMIVQSRILTVSGFLSALLLAPLCLSVEGIDRILAFAAAFAVMMILPGHLLIFREKRNRTR